MSDAHGESANVWPDRFARQVVLVTGAAGGLGAAASRRIVAEGGTVICTDVRASGDGGSPDACVALDVADRAEWARVVGATVAQHGRLDGALLAHGIAGPTLPLVETPVSDWYRTIEVNLTGCFFGLAEVLPVLRRQRYGRVVIVSSIGGREGSMNQSAYSASKGGVNAMVKAVAKECAADGVTVNAIAPSLMDTPMLALLDEKHRALLASRIPVGRPGTPEEFASLAAWALSRESSFITGQLLDLSGGRNVA